MNKEIWLFLKGNNNIHSRLRDQLSRASLGVMLNIAEGAGRSTKADKKHYYHQSRGSLFESLACLEVCYDLQDMSESMFIKLQIECKDISKMLFGMIKTLS